MSALNATPNSTLLGSVAAATDGASESLNSRQEHTPGVESGCTVVNVQTAGDGIGPTPSALAVSRAV